MFSFSEATYRLHALEAKAKISASTLTPYSKSEARAEVKDQSQNFGIEVILPHEGMQAVVRLSATPSVKKEGCSVAECWTQDQKGLGSNRSRDAVG